MTDSQLRQSLLEKLAVSAQALYQRAGRVKKQHGPMSTEDAIYWVAVDEGLDLSRFLPRDSVDRIRVLRQGATPRSHVSAIPLGAPPKRRKHSLPIPRAILVGEVKLSDPILSGQILQDAKRMAERAYPLVYVFENSVRETLRLVMHRAYGANWWNSQVPQRIRQQAQTRIAAEKNNAWHGRRGSHPIYYTNIGDLRSIVTSNWSQFEPILPSQTWFIQRVEEIEMSRNVLEHNNPLRARDISRIEMYLQDWQDQIASRRHLI